MNLKPMNIKCLRYWAACLLSFVIVGGSAAAAGAAANYCDPFAGCKHAVRVSPSVVKAGKIIIVRGSVAGGCKTPGVVTIYSRVFTGATAHRFAGVPAVSARANAKGRFSAKITLAKTIKSGRYRISGRCGGGNFGSTTLKVK